MTATKEEAKQLLLEYLRDGTRTQTKGTLWRVETYEDRLVGQCCLGVATEVAIDLGLDIQAEPYVEGRTVFSWPGPEAGSDENGDDGTFSQTAFAPTPVCELFGWSTSDPKVMLAGTSRTLSELNDMGVPFAIIADLIEEQL